MEPKLMPEQLMRQADLIPLAALDTPLTIIGMGAIGSWVALAAAKMGMRNITGFDHDDFNMVNMNAQFCRTRDIGRNKAIAVRDMVEEFTGVKIHAEARKYSEGYFRGVVISAVDSMEVRKLIWQNHRMKSLYTQAIIDPRMGAESALLFVVNPMKMDDADGYEKTLYSDKEAVEERCTAKATIYTANMLAGLVVKAVKDTITKQKQPLSLAQWDIAGNTLRCYNRNPSPATPL